MTPEQLLLVAVAAILVLTVGLGAALATGVYFFARQVWQISASAATKPTEVAPAAKPKPPVSPTAAAAPPRRGAAGLGIVIFILAIIVAGILAGRYAQLMPIEASTESGQVDVLFNAMLGIAVVIFLFVEGILLYSALRFRRKKGDESDGPPIHGSNRLEVAWTIIPAIIVTWLAVYSYQILIQLQTPRRDAMTIEVTGRQFQWQFHYPDSDVTSNDLHVPLGKPVRMKITSQDVIHSFWVPAFRVKQDAMPMRETDTYFTADALGQYRVVCAELCGAGHAQMGLTSYVIVESQADFDAWIARQKGATAGAGDPVGLFTTLYGCAGCHTLAAAGATGKVGPDLDGIGTAAGTRVRGQSAAAYVKDSILNPDAFIAPKCPGGPCPNPSLMPKDFGTRISPTDLDALVNFLLQQK
ncbi:MAG: cytochrome c oxidase subunit II [Chloroflexi bacterium]|nr:cytochrome c oxidase subunit II [Chloroflexota bacterium]